MAYFPKQIKDNEIPALHYLLDEILYNFFEDIYENIEGKDWTEYTNYCDSEDSKTKSISIESVKKIFKLYEKDTEYRPRYVSINFLIFGLVKKNMNFKSFQLVYATEIRQYSKKLEYRISEINFEPNQVCNKLITKRNELGIGALQIDLSDVFVSKLLQNIEPIIGSLISERLSDSNEINRYHENPRINTRLALKEAIRQNNIDNIIEKVIAFGNDKKPDNADIDSDWLIEFFNLSQDTSNDTMQFIWAKILADEVDSPGTFSRRTLNAVKLIDSDEAKIFTLLCNCLWEMNPDDTLFDRVLFKNSNIEGKFSDSTWAFNSELLKHLEDIGLIHETFIVLEKNVVIDLSYNKNHHQIVTSQNAVEIEVVRLSNIGEEIYEVVMTEPNNEYYQHTLKFFSENDLLKNKV